MTIPIPVKNLIDIPTLFMMNFQIYDQIIIHTREYYGILDLMGDLGGVLEIITIISGVFITPLSEYGFNLKAIQKLYIAST